MSTEQRLKDLEEFVDKLSHQQSLQAVEWGKIQGECSVYGSMAGHLLRLLPLPLHASVRAMLVSQREDFSQKIEKYGDKPGTANFQGGIDGCTLLITMLDEPQE
ncbi:hypothetical protein [Roseococcus pinisoli]|uniref:Uncharacterized protein n=1 Tax=Roseococcus pinisoli TaxID=2835040 RepID=A0ABS5QFE4_9PROT|nr:hypothetical protein [Roseococcus pinisoli]MBS7812289.1 hypothetical protein [Roseococcus pinisoli]